MPLIAILPVLLGTMVVMAMTARLRRLAALLRAQGATSPDRGVRADALPRDVLPLVPRLVQRGVLRETPGGTFWMDEAAYGAYVRRLVLLMAAGALLGAALGWVASRMGSAGAR